MTEAQFKEQLQTAQDMLDTVAQQRDGANNQIVQLVAQNKAKDRKIAELEAKLAETTEASPELDLTPSKANGHQPVTMN